MTTLMPMPVTKAETIQPWVDNRAITPIEADAIRYHLSNSRSKNTRLAYERQWNLYCSWCKEQGFQPFPAQPSTVILYLNHLGNNDYKVSKIQQALSAIKAVHQDNIDLLHAMGTAPDLSYRHPHIASTMNSLRRQMVTKGLNTVKKPRHFSQEEIRSMVQACPHTAQGIQDKAILLLGMNLGLRASEFIALTLSDLTFDETGVDIRIRSSKTDQLGAGETLFVARLSPSMWDFDAVKALEEWIAFRSSLGIAATDTLFIAFRKGGSTLHLLDGEPHRLTREAVSACIVRCANRAGIVVSSSTISSHSCRHTFVTTAFSRGVDPVTLAKSSRHKSMTVLMGYDQTSRRHSAVSVKLWA